MYISIKFYSKKINQIRNEGNHMGTKYLDCAALTIAIIGAVNWGLIGLFRFDLVAFIFGDMSWLSRIVYTLDFPILVRNKRPFNRHITPQSLNFELFVVTVSNFVFVAFNSSSIAVKIFLTSSFVYS